MSRNYGVFEVGPKLCILTSFLLYVLTGHTLDAEKVCAVEPLSTRLLILTYNELDHSLPASLRAGIN
jgi:hypothetical protein